MAISFSCACGKQLRAREQFAGRRMKCPDCQKVLTIPSAEELADLAVVETAAPERLEPAAEPDWFAAAVAEVAVAEEAGGVPPAHEPDLFAESMAQTPDEMAHPQAEIPRETTGVAPQGPPPLAQ